MRPNVYENKEEGIKCVYTNEKWLAVALLGEPQILILDEPINGVYPCKRKSDSDHGRKKGRKI